MPAKEVYTAFTKPGVLAILAGRKWQTRRVIKPQPEINEHHIVIGPRKWTPDGIYVWSVEQWKGIAARYYCRWQPDDILCIKEAYQIASNYGSRVNGNYLANDAPFSIELTSTEFARWKARKFPYRATSGRFMYKSLCRIKRPVIRSRVERIKDISYDDIDAEGVPPKPEQMSYQNDYYQRLKDFEYFWNLICPKLLFESDPWVWSVSFERRADG